MAPTKILFVAEAVTLAHVARPLALSAALPRERFEVALACDARCQWLLEHFQGRFLPLPSITTKQFLDALARGAPLYDEEILDRYVRDDLALLDEMAPDIVVGDFRLSLSVSARLAKIPYITISNCYWSPFWRPRHYPVPSLPLTRMLPLPLAKLLFQTARPLAFAFHCRPLNRVRRRHGLASLGSDLRRAYTDADYVLYADMPELFPEVRLPAHHRFIGPVIWSPPFDVPEWWQTIPAERPLVYVTMGSSGRTELLPAILRAFATANVSVIAATAGAELPDSIPPNAYIAPYLPGDEAARRASVVICNGGSPTCQQALVAGTPVLGIPSNLDQHLNMETVERAGAGRTLRADRFCPRQLRRRVQEMLATGFNRNAAARLARNHDAFAAPARFQDFLINLTSVRNRHVANGSRASHRSKV